MKGIALTLAILVVGFMAAWEALSRNMLPRIPQPDDKTFTIANYTPPVRPSVATPLGGVCPVGSIQICPAATDPMASTLRCDAMSSTTTALYLYDLGRGEWTTWAKLPQETSAWRAGGVYTTCAVGGCNPETCPLTTRQGLWLK